MAVTNQERVGKAMELLRAGLAPLIEREFKSQFHAQAVETARRYVGDDRAVGNKPIAQWDVAACAKPSDPHPTGYETPAPDQMKVVTGGQVNFGGAVEEFHPFQLLYGIHF